MADNLADDIFNRILLNENVWISIKISLKFVPNGPIDNKPVLVKLMAWHRTGCYLKINVDPVHWRIYTSLGEMS